VRARHKLAAAAAASLVAASAAGAAPPREGVLAPGASLGGLRLGMTKQQVRAAWGTRFGRCKGCRLETWYYNYRRFSPKGAAVEFRRDRVNAIFTLWQPRGWRTTKGLRLGEPEASVTEVHGTLSRAECGTYSAFLQRSRRALTAYYVLSGRVWGFGLFNAGAEPCR
jgi:hypothetical protein